MATHGSELPYLFDLPNAPFPPRSTPTSRRSRPACATAWANFAATGNPSSRGRALAVVQRGQRAVLSLVPPQPQVETDFATRHHCAFWAAG